MGGLNKNMVEDRLRRIVNVLLLNASFTDNLGLLNGKMGIAIFFYQYARYTGNKVYENYAGELIDEIYGEINNSTPVGFANGLMGIGWGIEYLVRNGYVDADTDEALSEIDNAVYRSSLHRPFLLDNRDDIFGYGLYYVTRLMGREDDDDNLKTLFKKQHLIYLTDDCERILVQKQFLDYGIDSLSIDTINSFLWFLVEMHRLGLFPVKVEKILRCLPEYVSQGFDAANGVTARFLHAKLAEKVVPFVKDTDTKNRLKSVLMENIGRENKLNVEDGARVSDFINGTWRRIIYGQQPGYDEILKEQSKLVFPVIDNEENWKVRFDKLDNTNIGLTGLTGFGLGLLSTSSNPSKAVKNRMVPVVSDENK